MIDLPEPFTSAEVNLTDFPRMPFEIERLRRSKAWLMAKKQPELGFYMINLWMASWHEKPPGSLEDDDEVLMDRALCKERRWPEVREQVMRNWIRCSDGRMYHKTVAEMVQYAWEAKQKHRRDTSAATAAAKAKRDALRLGMPPDLDDERDETVDSPSKVRRRSIDDPSTESDTEPKRREGNGSELKGDEGTGSEANASGAAAPPPTPDRPSKPKITDPDEIIFGYGVPLLVSAGNPEKSARSFLAKVRNAHGAPKVVDALRECIRVKPLQPLEWLAAALPPAGGRPKKAAEQADMLARAAEDNAALMREAGAGDTIDVEARFVDSAEQLRLDGGRAPDA